MKWENPHKVYNSTQYKVGTPYTLAIIVIIILIPGNFSPNLSI